MSLTEAVSLPTRPSYSCQHCQTSFRKLKTLQLHIREDHRDEKDEEQIASELITEDEEDHKLGENANVELVTSSDGGNEPREEEEGSESTEKITEEVRKVREITNEEGATSSEEGYEPEDTSVEGFESTSTEEIAPVEITPISNEEPTEAVVDAVVEEPVEDIDTVVVEDNSEDENDVMMTRDQDIPILPRETILKLIEKSEYFRSKPSIIRPFEPSFKNFDIIDSTLPRGFLMWEQARPSGKHVDREFLSPDGEFVLRSRVATTEFSKMILNHTQAAVETQSQTRRARGRVAPVKRRSARLTRTRKRTASMSISPQPKRTRQDDVESAGRRNSGNFKDKLKARLSSSRPVVVDVDDDDLMVLSSSLPATTSIKFQPAPSLSSGIIRAGVTITPVLPPTSRVRKKIKCCDMLFMTTAGFENHRAKKHKMQGTARKTKSELGEKTQSSKELPSSNQLVDFSCEYCEEKFPSKTELRKHDQTDHKYKCTNCKEAFLTKLAFLEHTKAKHIVPCSYCKKVCNSEDQLKGHLEKHHSFQCKNCEENFKSASSLSKHVTDKHHFKCSGCSKILESAEALEAHNKASHGRCEICCDDFYWPDSEHDCYYTRTKTRPPTARVVEQRLYRGYFFFSADD